MLNDFLENALFNVGDWAFTVSKLLGIVFITLIIFFVYWIFHKRWKKPFYVNNKISNRESKRFEKILRIFLLFLLLVSYLRVLDLEYEFYTTEEISINVTHIVVAFLILFGSRMVDWFLSNILIHKYYVQRDKGNTSNLQESLNKDIESSAIKVGQSLVYVLAVILILKNFHLNFTIFSTTIQGQPFDFKVNNILVAILVILIARLVVWLVTQIALYNAYRRQKIDEGAQFAINQLLKYVIYVIAFLIILQSLGINSNLILGGTAALLVGIGLGLQQTFNDFFSGLVLLFERSVSVGDIVNIQGMVGTVKKIGLRASLIETRDNVSVIVPNSKLVNDSVLNWSHFDDKIRFEIRIGVAYGTDTAAVKSLLLKAVKENDFVLSYPSPFVRFLNFGDSSLDFALFFFTKQMIYEEDLKSDIRFKIDELFREHGVSIPFPQREIHITDDRKDIFDV